MPEMNSRGQKQWAVMATKPKWSKPRFVWDGPCQNLLVFGSRVYADAEAKRINALGGGMLYPKGGNPISGVTFKAMPVWTETML